MGCKTFLIWFLLLIDLVINHRKFILNQFNCFEREQFVPLFLFNILFFQRTPRKLIKVNVLPGFPGLTNRKCYYCFNYICRWIARICFLPSGLLWYISYTCCLLATFVVGRPSVVFPPRFCYLYACAVHVEKSGWKRKAGKDATGGHMLRSATHINGPGKMVEKKC